MSHITSEDWEKFDAEALFAPPALHTNKSIKIDQRKMDKLDIPPEIAEQIFSPSQSSESREPQDGDSYIEVPVSGNHVDELYQMEASQDNQDSGSAVDREIKADKEEDRRENKDESEVEEKSIQKDSEGVEDVAEATSKTSEDIHGGDEATKDIENSPNAADNGKDSENHGAESGECGKQGEGSEGSTGGQGSKEGDASGNSLGEKDWEAKAEKSAQNAALEHGLRNWKQKRSHSSTGGGEQVDYRGYNAWTPESAQIVFLQVRELVKKLISEEDTSTKIQGSGRWWAEQLVKETTSFHHERIPSAKYERPRENRIVFFVDVSGSVSDLAELFMSLMGGVAGLPGVHIVVGSEAHAEREIVVKKPFKTVEAAIRFFGDNIHDPQKDAWQRDYENPFEPGIIEYLKDHNFYDQGTICVFFGDMQAVHFNTRELSKLVQQVKCLWLFTDEPGHFTHTGDLPRALEARLPIVYNVREARSFGKAVKRLSAIRPGMQIMP